MTVLFHRIPRRILAGALLAVGAAALLASCDLGGEVVSPRPPVVAQVVITSHADTVLATVASSVQFTAEAREAGGAPIANATIQWSSSAVNVAPVDATGRAVALTVGITEIRARSGSIQSAAVVLRVQPTRPVVASVSITGPMQVNVGSMAAFTAVASDAGGAPIAGAVFAWSSSNTNVASVNANGVATGLAPGSTDIRATSESIESPPSMLTVVAPVPSFAADIQPILHPTCTATNCHGGSFPQEGLDLRPASAYGQLVNRPSSQLPALLRVEPGNADNSYFYRKLLPCNPPNCGGSRMPRNLPPLPVAQIDLVRDWILGGAPP